MKHKKAKRLLFHYLLKTLPPGEQRKIESHLESCEICRKEYQHLKLLRAQTQTAAQFKLSDSVLKATKLSLREEYSKISSSAAEGAKGRRKGFPVRDMADKLMAWLRWIMQPAVLTSLLLLFSLIIYGLTMVQNNGLVAINLPFTLFRPVVIH